VKRAEHSSAFSAFVHPKAKIVLLGSDGSQFAELKAEARSFSIEHVSPAILMQQEISRRTSPGLSAFPRSGTAISRSARRQNADQLQLAVLRKWFWARKPDAGFLLEGFPATLLQAKVFDEWIEARGETLTACLVAGLSSETPGMLPGVGKEPVQTGLVVAHYRTQGLLRETPRAAA
jgi:adenylate kinase